MVLSAAQLSTIKAWIIANHASVFEQSTVNVLNATASPDFWVWRTSVEKKEVTQAVSQDATTFTWAGNGFNRQYGKELARDMSKDWR